MKEDLKRQMDEMDKLLCRLLWGQLQSIGLFNEIELDIHKLKAEYGIVDIYSRWLEESMAVLIRNNYLKKDKSLYIIADPTPIDLEREWDVWRQLINPLREVPNHKALINLVEATMRALPEILTGKILATDIMFPNSSMELVEGIYKNNPVADYFNEVLADSVCAYIKARSAEEPSARINIIEIGAGTGGTSIMIFKKLKPYREHIQDYCYTDISRAFLMHAEKEYGLDNPYLTYKIFNVEKPIAGQDIIAGEYDIAIAANVLHATIDIHQTLRNVKAVLKKNGLLLLNEISSNSLFAHLTFGLLEGWWLYEDPEIRIPGSPALSSENWQTVLESESFRSIIFPAHKFHDLGQQIIIAESDGLVRLEQPVQPNVVSAKKKTIAKIPPDQPPQKASLSIPFKEITRELLVEKVTAYIKKLIGDTLKIPGHKIDNTAPLEKYGIDSILVVQLTNQLSKILTNISSTLFFEYQTIDALVEYLIKTQKDSLVKLIGLADQEFDQELPGDQKELALPSSLRSNIVNGRPKHFLPSNDSEIRTINKQEIAIIGLSGRYPGANNVNEYWRNLRAGKNCISEIPKERWDWREYFSEERGKLGTIYTKWGGFITDIDKFDPLFFQISPREAESMDPQERVFLEEAYASIEDAGYTPATLCDNRKIGVFVGVMNANYPGGASYWSIANRLSYLFNFQGPSMAVDTACSSSLTAIHLAMESILNGNCDYAIAGGVNLIVNPIHYMKLTRATMLSASDQCKAFGDGADGFVDGEGVGAIVLKPLTKAIADGDHIYGILKGSMVNAGGKTNGYTVPNPVAQKELIQAALEKSGVNARTISYVEAHGTGTKLGDPIEITGLTQAFRQDTEETGYCAIGSAKTNIGHLEAAAGIAGLTKVLLQMKHHELVPSLHSRELNSYIDFNNTPFVVQQELSEWKRPVLEINRVWQEYSRIAGISAFGAGGANAHLLIEEYIPETQEELKFEVTPGNQVIIVLSAKKEEQLKERVRRLLTAIEEQQFIDADLADIAYSLQIGREAMEERLGVIITSIKELTGKLTAYLAGEENIEYLYLGQVKQNQEVLAIFSTDEEMQEAIQKWIERKKYGKMVELWVNGIAFDWQRVYGESKPRRISLPTYPFAREQYWLTEIEIKSGKKDFTTVIHPMLQQNTSDLSEQRYSSIFTGQEFFLTNHVVNGEKILPGVAYLEMARAAVEVASGNMTAEKCAIKLENIIWAKPIGVGEQPVEVHIGLYPEDNDRITYEIYSRTENDDSEAVVNSQGWARLIGVNETPVIDLKTLQTECNQKIPGTEIYNIYRTIGFEYGPGHQGIEAVYIGPKTVLAKLLLPSSIVDTEKDYVLHPSMMDSALQALIGIKMGEEGSLETSQITLPFALQELEVYNRCTGSMWAVIRYNEDSAVAKIQKSDMDLCDEQGKVCVRIKGFSTRVLDGEVGIVGPVAIIKNVMFEPVWNDQSVGEFNEEPSTPGYTRQLVILCEPEEATPESIENGLNGVSCLSLQSKQKSIAKRYEGYAVQVFEAIQKMLAEKPAGKVLVQLVVSGDEERHLFMGLFGILKTAQLENPKIMGQVIEFETPVELEGLIDKLKENRYRQMDSRIRYHEGKRQVADWSEVTVSPESASIPWKDGGVYLITGGVGGLGMIFAKEITERVKGAILVLTGRSPLSEAKQAELKKMESMETRIEYRAEDVSNQQAVNKLIQSIIEEFGGLDGIIHSAGVIRDNFIIKKSKEELQEVLSPKVAGLLNLDLASKDLSLDFMILFSSIAGILGNPGQADYATANAFMDAYAKYRNSLVSSGKRKGRTLSINWPLWQEGGMRVEHIVGKMMRQNTGMVAMRTSTGIKALYDGFASGRDQVMVLEGDIRRIRAAFIERSVFGEHSNMSSTPVKPEIPTNVTRDQLQEKTSNYLKKILSPVIKLPVERIEADISMEKYGIDSVMVMELTNQMEKTFGSLPKTLFYEYQTIQELSGYFLETYREQLNLLIGIEKKEETTSNPSIIAAPKPVMQVMSPIYSYKKSRFRTLQPIQETKTSKSLDIAIIGVSGRYPQARNLDEFWWNLRDGIDCITEIPNERWDHSQYFDPDKNKPGKTFSKWGGFIEGVDQFDPLFFNISPREAEIMIPQERLFLETVWGLLEKAGYTRDNLKSLYQSRIGVFVGAMDPQYQPIDSNSPILSADISSIANRVSYYFDFQGPSIAVNTVCSSSGIAIHMACESLIREECQMAIAGGVNLVIHPQKYISYSSMQMIGSHPNSRSFGDGDGFLPGEGVGAVLLKPLAQAVRDRDNILAVVKSTAINHGGHTNGYMVPNPNLQAQLIQDNFRKSGIDPQTISYVEAAALGSAMGDPIEVTALTKAFKQFTEERQFCAIGSVQSNIGHPEAASGISQLTKVILQLQHQQLVPSIKAEPLNPKLSFENTPFYLQQELQEWQRPVIRFGAQEQEFPRRATISSFGAGGSNVHLIVEEYIHDQAEPVASIPEVNLPRIVVLSAKNKERLQAGAEQLLDFIEHRPEISLLNLAYTLQVGREAMDYRVAIVVGSISELIRGLKMYLGVIPDNQANEAYIPVFKGESEINQFGLNNLLSGKTEETLLQQLFADNNLVKLARYWVSGGKIPWESLYKNTQTIKIALPTYPFARERYWLSNSEAENKPLRLVQPSRSENGHFQIDASELLPENIQNYLIHYISQELNLTSDKIRINKNIGDYGANSITITKIIREVENLFDIKITNRDMLELKTIESIALHLSKKITSLNNLENKRKPMGKLEDETTTLYENINDPDTEILENLKNGFITLDEAEKLIKKVIKK